MTHAERRMNSAGAQKAVRKKTRARRSGAYYPGHRPNYLLFDKFGVTRSSYPLFDKFGVTRASYLLFDKFGVEAKHMRANGSDGAKHTRADAAMLKISACALAALMRASAGTQQAMKITACAQTMRKIGKKSACAQISARMKNAGAQIIVGCADHSVP